MGGRTSDREEAAARAALPRAKGGGVGGFEVGGVCLAGVGGACAELRVGLDPGEKLGRELGV
jgi:hypothetical protein